MQMELIDFSSDLTGCQGDLDPLILFDIKNKKKIKPMIDADATTLGRIVYQHVLYIKKKLVDRCEDGGRGEG